MNGVQILSQNPIMKNPEWGILVFIIGIIGVLIGCILLATLDRTRLISSVIMSISIILIFISFAVEEPTDKYEYKVTIDNAVSFNEFNQKYRIIEQDGLIFTVIERKLK